jgi:nucleoside-diphosphate-sugar epimerase
MAARSFLVTGGTGFLGSALVRRLVKDGGRVRVLDDDSRGRTSRLDDIRDHIEFVAGDIRDAEAVSKATKGMDTVCHLAFVNGTEFFYSKPDLVLDVGVRGMINVLDACMEHGVGDFVLASSSEVYQTPPVTPTDESAPLSIPDPLNPRYSYAGGKIISELMAVNYGRNNFDRVVIFRPHNVYGPDMGWEHVLPQFVLRMRDLAKSTDNPVPFPIQGDGQQSRSFVFIDDFIDGLKLMIDKGEHLGIYHIGTQEEVTMAEAAALVAKYFKRDIVLVPGPAPAGGTPRRCPDISKLQGLGYQPHVPIRDGLPILAKWYDDHADQAPTKEGQAA